MIVDTIVPIRSAKNKFLITLINGNGNRELYLVKIGESFKTKNGSIFRLTSKLVLEGSHESTNE